MGKHLQADNHLVRGYHFNSA